MGRQRRARASASRIERAERKVVLAIRQLRWAERELERVRDLALAEGVGPARLEELVKQ